MAPRRLLVVEDDPDMMFFTRYLLENTLGKDSFDMVEANTVEQARAVDWSTLDAAAVDWMLPGPTIDGVHLAAEIVGDDADVAVCVFSAAPDGALHRMQEEGLDVPLVPKPYTGRDLVAAWGWQLERE